MFTEGQTDRRKEGRTDRQTEGQTKGRTEGRTDGRMDGQTDRCWAEPYSNQYLCGPIGRRCGKKSYDWLLLDEFMSQSPIYNSKDKYIVKL